jgi:hypothetical protein
MASYSIAASEIAAYAKVLVASTVDTITFTASDRIKVRVTNDTGTAALFFTTDGVTDPTVNGAACERVPASAGAYVEVDIATGTATVVKVISSGTPTYSVQGWL